MSVKHLLSQCGVLLFSFEPWFAIAQSNQQQPRWDWPGPWHMWSGGWSFWWLFPLLMFGLLTLFAFFMLRGSWSEGGRHTDTTRGALTLLNERFAKGDISKEEYEEKKTILLRRS
jgi:putative membrane protein